MVNGEVLQPDELADYWTGIINKKISSFLEGKPPYKQIPFSDMLETYKKTPIFIPADITEFAVESAARKLSGSSGLGGTYSEALQG